MKKIVTNALVVGTQLIVGGLFLFMLFSDNNEDSRVVVVENNNLNKMADAVTELFVVDHAVVEMVDTTSEEELISSEEKKRQEEEAARLAAEEAARIAAEEEAARLAAEEEAKKIIEVDPTGYISNPAVGFEVTTGNKMYSLSDEEFAVLATVVNCEASKNGKDDILGVMSVILNRADSSRYPNDPVSVVAAPSQFSCYNEGVVNNNVSGEVISVMKDALNGIRNNKFYSFNAWYTNRSENYIVTGGNRYF